MFLLYELSENAIFEHSVNKIQQWQRKTALYLFNATAISVLYIDNRHQNYT